ncbi:carbohydrate-binding protein [Cohnella endophytica]|uniref:Carbohydrate-binding protein n=1 Tax=Cohnella endophytica TaxID=2419778 RepID=A0A494Y4A9_9BACL|nr:carbohydrate-binding protein [Cohnella endophytica]
MLTKIMNLLWDLPITLRRIVPTTNVNEAVYGGDNHVIINISTSTSIGKFVGTINYSDRYIDFYIKVPTTKTYTMTILYTKGTGANATHYLFYNGGACSAVKYPAYAGWGQFITVNVNVNLTAGHNVNRLVKGSMGLLSLTISR